METTGEASTRDVSGEVVISNLFNRAMVLLNYRLDDVAALRAEPCACGRSLPFIEGVQGRLSEIVTLADGRKLSGLHVEGFFREELRQALKVQIGPVASGRDPA